MRKLIFGIFILFPVSALAFILFGSALLSMPSQTATGASYQVGGSLTGLSAYAERTIPLAAQKLYTDPRVHAECPQLPAAVLAGIGTVETDNGLAIATSPTGAQGFMQFEPATFATYGVAIGHSGPPDINNHLDSVASAAHLLCQNWDKKMSTITKVIHDVYNHAWWYACDGVPGCPLNLDGPGNQPPSGSYRGVMAWAKLYTPPIIAGMASGNLPPAVRTAIAYARTQIGKPYIWGGTGPIGYDCSGLMMMAYQQAGFSIPRVSEQQWPWGPQVPAGQEQPGDLVFFAGSDGTTASPGHVGMVIGPHLMIEAYATGYPIRISHYGTPDSAQGDTNPIGFTRPWQHH